jgi:ribosomal protein S8E
MFALSLCTNAQVQDRKKSRLALRAAEERKEEKKKKQFSLLRAANVHKTCIQSVHNVIMAGGEEKGRDFLSHFSSHCRSEGIVQHTIIHIHTQNAAAGHRCLTKGLKGVEKRE